MRLELPIHTLSPLNQRDHWRVTDHRKKCILPAVQILKLDVAEHTNKTDQDHVWTNRSHG